MALLRIFVALLFMQLAQGKPTVSFPFNAQLPPVARVGNFFTYSFSRHTFASDSELTYTLGKHPDWLSIESDKRRIYGTPDDASVPDGDVIGELIDIIATDDSGSTPMNATLVVSRNSPPAIQVPLEEQIKTFGNFSAPSSILSYPSTEFKYSFDQNTFGGKKKIVNYYAVSGNNSPLPAWIAFDAGSLTFSGRTPPFESLVQPPQTFDFNLVASDIVGFSAASIQFSIVVGRHKLTTDNPIISLNATRGTEFSYNGLENGVKLDGKSASPGSLDVTIDDMPDWLSFDKKTHKLQGTPEKGDHATNFTIHFHDPFADTLDVLAVVNVATGLFKSTFEDINIRPGSQFSLDLTSYFRNPSDVDFKITTQPDEGWLKVDGFKLSGRVPQSSKGSFKVLVDASSKSSDMQETETLGVSFLAVDGTPITPTSSPVPGDTGTETADPDASESSSGRLSTGEILLATIIPVIFLAVLIMFLVCFFRRRRVRQTYLNSTYRTKISHPIANSLRGLDQSQGSSLHSGNMTETTRVDTHVFKPGKIGYNDVSSRTSLRPRSSETLGNTSAPDVQRSIISEGNRAETIKTVSSRGSGEERQSWVTVDGATTMPRTEKSFRSHRSDTTFPESVHQAMPTTSLLSEVGKGTFRSYLDITVPSLEPITGVQATPNLVYLPPKRAKPRRSVDAFYSTPTEGSAALLFPNGSVPPGHNEAIKGGLSQATLGENADDDTNWVSVAESEAAESISGLRKPDALQLSGHPSQYESRILGGGRVSSSDTSFGSSENWRVIPNKPNSPNFTHKETVEEVAFNPLRPITPRDGARPGERTTPEPLSWQSRYDTPLKLSASIVSDLSDVGETKSRGGVSPGHEMPESRMSWMRDDSGKISEGSFKMFI